MEARRGRRRLYAARGARVSPGRGPGLPGRAGAGSAGAGPGSPGEGWSWVRRR